MPSGGFDVILGAANERRDLYKLIALIIRPLPAVEMTECLGVLRAVLGRKANPTLGKSSRRYVLINIVSNSLSLVINATHMTTYLVQIESDEDRVLFEALVKKMRFKSRKMSSDDAEDAALLIAMEPFLDDERVSRSEVMKSLRSK